MPRRMNNNPALYQFDALQRQQHGNLCGVDEAGRGPLCGPVCVAAVILNQEDPIDGVNDSKKLSEKRRGRLSAHGLQTEGEGRCGPGSH